jgi:hypothetical protein
MQPTAQAVGGLEMIQAPEGRKKLTPDIFLVHDNPILLEECAEFVLKGMLLVMFFLSRNVFRYGGDTPDSLTLKTPYPVCQPKFA